MAVLELGPFPSCPRPRVVSVRPGERTLPGQRLPMLEASAVAAAPTFAHLHAPPEWTWWSRKGRSQGKMEGTMPDWRGCNEAARLWEYLEDDRVAND